MYCILYIGQARNVELFGTALQPYSRTRNYRTDWGTIELQYNIHRSTVHVYWTGSQRRAIWDSIATLQ